MFPMAGSPGSGRLQAQIRRFSRGRRRTRAPRGRRRPRADPAPAPRRFAPGPRPRPYARFGIARHQRMPGRQRPPLMQPAIGAGLRHPLQRLDVAGRQLDAVRHTVCGSHSPNTGTGRCRTACSARVANTSPVSSSSNRIRADRTCRTGSPTRRWSSPPGSWFPRRVASAPHIP